MNLRERVEKLQEYIKTGRIIEAMNEFYDSNVSMQENAGPATVGLAANIEREKVFLSNVKEWKGYTVKALAVGDEVSMVENTIDFINTQGAPVHYEQVTVQRWKNGKVISERFYYDTGGAK